jgi:hypothetical protein
MGPWKLPEKTDILEYELSDVLVGIIPLKLVLKVGLYYVSELSTFFEFGILVGYSVLYKERISYNTLVCYNIVIILSI